MRHAGLVEFVCVIAVVVTLAAMLYAVFTDERDFECDRHLERGVWLDSEVDYYMPVVESSYVNGQLRTTTRQQPVYETVRNPMTIEEYKEKCVEPPR